VKKFTFKQEHLAQRRRGAETTNKIKQLFTSYLCASASLREMLHFFTGSRPRLQVFSPDIMPRPEDVPSATPSAPAGERAAFDKVAA
jgi:hypothetical protein